MLWKLLPIGLLLAVMARKTNSSTRTTEKAVVNKVEPALTTKPMRGKLRKTSGFGVRKNPRSKARELKMHTGIDLDATKGDPIYAVGDGTVVYAQFHTKGYGNHVRIDHGNGLITRYAHMDQLPLVKVGDKIKAGTQIGVAGTTGSSTGVHLHLGVYKKDVAMDPEKAMPFLLS